MQASAFRFIAIGLVLVVSVGFAQERESSPRPTRAPAKGLLPDPTLLDGSKEAAEKRPEHGMLGEFELPGNEKSQSDKVGGSQQEGSGQQDQSNPSKSGGAGAAAAGGGQKEDAQQQQQGQGSEPTGAQGAAGAKAEGIQASGLSDPQNGSAASQSDAPPPKPGDMKMGDATMQIKMLPPGQAAAVVGMEPQQKGKETPQSYDAKTPGGGKQSTGRSNQGVERGKVMPAGL